MNIYYLGFIPVIITILLINILKYKEKEFCQPIVNGIVSAFIVAISSAWAIIGLMGIK
jgi:uncharacterized membrane protein YfhO